MLRAIDLARLSRDEIPVGALVVEPSTGIVSEGVNTREKDSDITGHAEINALKSAIEKVGSKKLSECVLFTTLEPCPMCAFAMREARISKLVFGAFDLKQGSAGSRFDILREGNLGPFVEVIGGVLESDCSQLMRDFFIELRNR